MTHAEHWTTEPRRLTRWSEAVARTLRQAAPALLFGLRLWASVCLALYIAFWLELDNAYWAGTTAAIVCQPHLGASLRKGWYRLIGTVVGAIAIVVMTACFPQDRAAFFLVLALWGAGCALLSSLLRNFAAYSAALAGYTAAIIASDQLGAVGGLNGQAFMLAVNRASEICIGIVCAGIVLALTDLGGPAPGSEAARQPLGEIACCFTGTLADAGAEFEQTQTIRRELVRRVVASTRHRRGARRILGTPLPLSGPAECFGWSRQGSRQLAHGAAVFARSRQEQAQRKAGALLAEVPEPFCAKPGEDEAAGWIVHPARLLQACEAAVSKLSALPATTPSLRLLADQAAEALSGVSQALIALALLVADPADRLIVSAGGAACAPCLASAVGQCRARFCRDRRRECSGSLPHGPAAPTRLPSQRSS